MNEKKYKNASYIHIANTELIIYQAMLIKNKMQFVMNTKSSLMTISLHIQLTRKTLKSIHYNLVLYEQCLSGGERS